MIIRLPPITLPGAKPLQEYLQFASSMPIDGCSSLTSLRLENVFFTDGFMERMEELKVEEMHWNYTSFVHLTAQPPIGSFASVKRFSGKFDGPLSRKSSEMFPLAEKMVIHYERAGPNSTSQYNLDFSESKSLQCL